jgi:hypothetical protein
MPMKGPLKANQAETMLWSLLLFSAIHAEWKGSLRKKALTH